MTVPLAEALLDNALSAGQAGQIHPLASKKQRRQVREREEAWASLSTYKRWQHASHLRLTASAPCRIMVSPTSMADMVPVDEVRAIDVNWGRSRRCAGGGHHGNTSLRCLIRREMTRACHRAPVNSNLSIDPPGRSGNVLTTRCRGSGRLVTSARRGGALCPFVGRVTIITNRLPNPTSSDAATSVTRTTDGPPHHLFDSGSPFSHPTI